MAAFRGGSDDPSYVLVINTHHTMYWFSGKKMCIRRSEQCVKILQSDDSDSFVSEFWLLETELLSFSLQLKL